MLKNILSYLANLPVVFHKLQILHRFSVFLDEASPKDLEKSLKAWRLIKREYGFLRSLKERQCVDAHGQPIPWYSYPAIEQLKLWDFQHCEVLEYGCGNSTRWWAKRARSVISIENSASWHAKIAQDKPQNCELILAEVDDSTINTQQLQHYIDVIDTLGTFDIIIVDGVNQPGVRKHCTEKAVQHLKPGGLIIIDNSDWLPKTCAYLREQGFMEIDFSGLSPLNSEAETTSLFFKADFKIKPLSSIHPGYATGGLKIDSDSAD